MALRPVVWPSPRDFARMGLVWLALILPMAQAAAAWHALSHVDLQARQYSDEPQALQQAPCDLCLAAAAIGDGGLPAAVHGAPLPAMQVAKAFAVPVDVWLSPTVPGYSSRAPPHSPR